MKLVIDPDVLSGAFIDGSRKHRDFAFKVIEILKLIKTRRESTSSPCAHRLEIFISYKSEDYERASYIEETLRDDHSVWFDKERLKPGEPWDPALDQAIKKSDIFLYCYSKNSKRERSVQIRELNWARKVQDDLPRDGKYIIPVLLEKVDLPIEITDYERVELYDERGRGWTKLQTFLTAEAERLAGIRKKKKEEEASLFLCEDEPPSKFSVSEVARRYKDAIVNNEVFDDWYEDIREEFSAFIPVSPFPLPSGTLPPCRDTRDEIFVNVARGAGTDAHLISDLGVSRNCLQGHSPGTCTTIQQLCSKKSDKVLSVDNAFESLRRFEKWLQENA